MHAHFSMGTYLTQRRRISTCVAHVNGHTRWCVQAIQIPRTPFCVSETKQEMGMWQGTHREILLQLLPRISKCDRCSPKLPACMGCDSFAYVWLRRQSLSTHSFVHGRGYDAGCIRLFTETIHDFWIHYYAPCQNTGVRCSMLVPRSSARATRSTMLQSTTSSLFVARARGIPRHLIWRGMLLRIKLTVLGEYMPVKISQYHYAYKMCPSFYNKSHRCRS